MIAATVALLGLMLAFVVLLVLVGGYGLGVALAAAGAVTDLALQISGHLFGGPGAARNLPPDMTGMEDGRSGGDRPVG
jgi:hypothetical protein